MINIFSHGFRLSLIILYPLITGTEIAWGKILGRKPKRDSHTQAKDMEFDGAFVFKFKIEGKGDLLRLVGGKTAFAAPAIAAAGRPDPDLDHDLTRKNEGQPGAPYASFT